jgi:hypothetical protein
LISVAQADDANNITTSNKHDAVEPLFHWGVSNLSIFTLVSAQIATHQSNSIVILVPTIIIVCNPFLAAAKPTATLSRRGAEISHETCSEPPMSHVADQSKSVLQRGLYRPNDFRGDCAVISRRAILSMAARGAMYGAAVGRGIRQTLNRGVRG